MSLRSGPSDRDRVHCPQCAAAVSGAKRYFIDWSNDNREFTVVLAFQCGPCHFRFEEENIKTLPVAIASQSTCSCGATLSLRDYSLRRVSDDEVEFEGVYKCLVCAMEKRSLIGQLKSLVYRIWNKTTILEVGPTGVRLEKADGEID